MVTETSSSRAHSVPMWSLFQFFLLAFALMRVCFFTVALIPIPTHTVLPSCPSSSKNSCCQGSFQQILDLSVSGRRKVNRPQPLVQQLVSFGEASHAIFCIPMI